MILSLFTASLLLAALPIGLIPTLLDGVKKPMQARLNLPAGRADWYLRLFYFSWLPAMPLAGWLIDEAPSFQKDALFLAIVALILGLAWLALARSFTWLLPNALLIGVAYSFLTTIVVRLMTLAFFPQARPNAIAGLNVGFIAVGVGALVGPWIVQGLERLWGYRQGLLYLSLALIVPGALIACNDRADFPVLDPHDVPWDAVLGHPFLAMIVGVMLVYFAVENCLEFWPQRYLQDLGYRDRTLDLNMLVFWLAFIGMRGVAATWLYAHPTHGIIVTILLVIAAAIVLGNLVSGFEMGSGTLAFWLLGACYGPLLPCLLGIAVTLNGGPVPASTLGALLALSGLDTLLVRPILSAYGKDRPARKVMRVPTVLALLMAAPLVLMLFLPRR